MTGSAATARALFRSACWAGGASEDPTPLWGWYYRSGNDKAPAWSGVEPFWRFFTRSDREDGLRGVECGPEDLQPGDVIQLSFDGRRYAHCLLVVGTGRQILVCAHDEDSDFRPLSTYERQKTRLPSLDAAVQQRLAERLRRVIDRLRPGLRAARPPCGSPSDRGAGRPEFLAVCRSTSESPR